MPCHAMPCVHPAIPDSNDRLKRSIAQANASSFMVIDDRSCMIDLVTGSDPLFYGGQIDPLPPPSYKLAQF